MEPIHEKSISVHPNRDFSITKSLIPWPSGPGL